MNKKRNYMPKTPKEKLMFVGFLVCVGVFAFSLAMLTIGTK